MITPHIHKRAIERVREIYVAVFPVPIDEYLSVEVVLAGYQKDSDMQEQTRVRATVETNATAIQDLVTLCDRIVDEQEEIESYRLLKFDQDGIHVLSPEDFRSFEQEYAHVQWGCC